MENKKLLESFYQLIGDLGYANFGIERLAQVSGVDEEYIYEEFENKEKLLLEVMNYVYLKEKALIFKVDKTKDLKEELVDKGIMFIKLNKYDNHYSTFRNQVLLIALSNDLIKKALSKIITQYVELFEEIIIELGKTYNIKGNKNLAYEIYLLLDSVILYENYKKDMNAEEVWKDFINRIFFELK